MNSNVKIRDEELLLLALCRLEFSDEQLKKLKAVLPVISDWNYFSTLANSHGVAALAWHNLEKHKLSDGIPDDVTTYLRGALMKSLSRNVFNTESICEVLRLLNAGHIKTVLLKGMALENSVYGNAGLRQMSDVDILITRDECIGARNILKQNGYVSLPVKSLLHNLIILDIGKHLPSLIKNGASIEIHHELFGEKNNGLTRLFYDSSFEIEISGEKTYIPQPQIFFLYLVRHLHLHEMNNESQLRLYTDLVVMIEKYGPEIINNDLLKLASQAGMKEILAHRLQTIRDLWLISFPSFICEFIEQWSNPESTDRFLFFLKSPKDNPPPDRSGSYSHIIGDIHGLHRKMIYVLGDIFPSVSFMKKRYGNKSGWRVLFYYPHRIGKLWWLIKRR